MSKQHSGQRTRIIGVLCGILALLLIAATINYLRPLPAIRAEQNLQISATTTPTPLSWPANVEAAVGAVGYGLLTSQGEQTPRPTASVAKLITALSVLQKYPLQVGQPGPTITLTAADVTMYQQYLAEQGSVVVVQAGEQLTEYQALQAMMLPSANNIADSLAIWAFGSLSSYATYANQYAATLGLSQTHIGSDASGFLPDTTSTAHDLVLLGLLVLKNPVLAEIIDQPSAVLPVAGTVHNVNYLLGTDGIIGIKTGNSDQAGGVYLFAAKDVLAANQSVTIVGAVQGSADLSTALSTAIPLLNSTKQNFMLTTIAQAGQVVGHYETPWKTSVAAVATQNVQAIAWSGLSPKWSLTLRPLKAPKSAGFTIGKLTVSSGNSVTTTPVALNTTVPNPPFLWRLLR